MIQPKTQTREYWEREFSLTDADIEQIYNHFLEELRPQSTDEIVRAVMVSRIAAEKQEFLRQIRDRRVYQPANTYEVGDDLVFPLFDLTPGKVTGSRVGYNPQDGEFQVLTVKLRGKLRDFAAGLGSEHVANLGEGGLRAQIDAIDAEQIMGEFASLISSEVQKSLESRDEFIVLGGKWFVKTLLVDVSIGHLHLAEAVLDMSGGGPLKTEEITVHLDLDAGADDETQIYSLNYALLNDDRFDEVAPKNSVAWFLRRMEPEIIKTVPERLVYDPVEYNPEYISKPLQMIVREIGDEWSNLEPAIEKDAHTFSLPYSHRLLGTMPLNGSIRALMPLGRSARQLFIFRNMETGEELNIWASKEGRYLTGFKEWYEQNSILVGAYLTIRKGPGNVMLFDYKRRRPQTEDVRLATVADGRIRFDLQRRRIACQYDDLLTVGTDYTAAIDAVWKRARTRSLAQLIAVLLPELASLSPQNAVHAKTLYAILNMVMRMPPGPIFAELVRHPAFVPIGEHYWRFDTSRIRRG
ncbi:MAG: hypothetical protein ACPG8W_02870 [Candidatus Promineifilaceae bacterium]